MLVGDAHGCADELQLLLDAVSFVPDVDTLVMLGDLVAKVPLRCLEHSARVQRV